MLLRNGDLKQTVITPGSHSGVYYIPLANIPFGMTNTELRTIALKAGEVEECLIYPHTQVGWIRVRGPKTYLAVYNHINGYSFKGSVIVASRQNEESSVYIWDHRKITDEPGSSSAGGAAGMQMMPGGPAYCAATAEYDFREYNGFNAFNGVTAYNNSMSTAYSTVYSQQDPHATLNVFDTSFMSQALELEGSEAQMLQMQSADAVANSAATSAAAAAASAAIAAAIAQYVRSQDLSYPDQCKVLVKRLSRHASRKELDAFLCEAIGGRQKLREPIRFPRGGASGGSDRMQHAFLIFREHEDALRGISRLHCAFFCGLAIEARFVHELVPSMTSVVGAGAGGAGRSDGAAAAAAAATTEGEDDKASDSSSSSGHETPIVVDGSSSHVRAAKTETHSVRGKDKTKDRKGKGHGKGSSK